MAGRESGNPLSIRLLTGGDLVIDSPTAIRVQGINPRALLILLALKAGERVSRDKLAGLLWPDTDQQKARNRLATTLSVLRRALNPLATDLLSADKETIMLTCGNECVDVGRFRTLIKDEDTNSIQQAMDLYHRDLLAGFPSPSDVFDDYLRMERELLRDLAIEAGSELAARFEREDNFDALQVIARKVLAIEPAEEKIHRAVIRALIAMGESAAALKQFMQCRQALAETYDASPSEETLALVNDLKGADVEPDEPMPAAPAEEGSRVSVDTSQGVDKPRPGKIRRGFLAISLTLILPGLSAPFLWRTFFPGTGLLDIPVYLAPVAVDSCSNPRVGPDIQSLVYRALRSVPQLEIEQASVEFDRGHRLLAIANCAGNEVRLVLEFHLAGSHILCWIESYEARYPVDWESLRIRVTEDIRAHILPLLRSDRNSCR